MFFANPIYYFRTFSFSFSLPRRNSDTGSLSRLFFPFLLVYGTCLHFYPEKTSPLSSRFDSHQIAPTHADISQQFVDFFDLSKFIVENKLTSPTHVRFELQNQTINRIPAFEGITTRPPERPVIGGSCMTNRRRRSEFVSSLR